RTTVSNGAIARTSSRSAACTGEPRSSTRQLSLDAPAQLLRAERLRDVVVRADLKASIDVGVLTTRSEQDHPHVGSPRIGAQVPQDLKSTEFRHHHVENAEIRAFCLSQHETRLAVRRGDHPVAVVFQAEADDVEDVLFVVDYEYSLGGGRRNLHSSRLRLCPCPSASSTLPVASAPIEPHPDVVTSVSPTAIEPGWFAGRSRCLADRRPLAVRHRRVVPRSDTSASPYRSDAQVSE